MRDITYQQIRITRNQWGDDIDKTVKAWLVAGETGIFGAYKQAGVIFICSGDDGNWRDIWCCVPHWLNDVIRVLQKLDT